VQHKDNIMQTKNQLTITCIVTGQPIITLQSQASVDALNKALSTGQLVAGVRAGWIQYADLTGWTGPKNAYDAKVAINLDNAAALQACGLERSMGSRGKGSSSRRQYVPVQAKPTPTPKATPKAVTDIRATLFAGGLAPMAPQAPQAPMAPQAPQAPQAPTLDAQFDAWIGHQSPTQTQAPTQTQTQHDQRWPTPDEMTRKGGHFLYWGRLKRNWGIETANAKTLWAVARKAEQSIARGVMGAGYPSVESVLGSVIPARKPQPINAGIIQAQVQTIEAKQAKQSTDTRTIHVRPALLVDVLETLPGSTGTYCRESGLMLVSVPAVPAAL